MMKSEEEGEEEVKEWEVNMEEPTFKEVSEVVKKAKNNKSSIGPPIELFKHSVQAREILHEILKRIWKGESPPDAWLTAQITLLHKKGPTNLAKNYRPISIL